MTEAVTPDLDERCPIWARYTNQPTDRKCEQIERVLANAGARFGVHVGRVGIGVHAPSVIFSDVDWIEYDGAIWIEAYIPGHNAERTVSELRACGCVAGVGEADMSCIGESRSNPQP